MRPDDRAVERAQIKIYALHLSPLSHQCLDDAGPCAIAFPFQQSAVDRGARPVSLGKIAPLSSGAQNPKDAIDRFAVRGPRVPHLAGMFRREMGLDQVPLLVA